MTTSPRVRAACTMASDHSRHSDSSSNRSIKTFESISVELIRFVAKDGEQFLAAHAHFRCVAQMFHQLVGLGRAPFPAKKHASALDDEIDFGIGEETMLLANRLGDRDLAFARDFHGKTLTGKNL